MSVGGVILITLIELGSPAHYRQHHCHFLAVILVWIHGESERSIDIHAVFYLIVDGMWPAPPALISLTQWLATVSRINPLSRKWLLSERFTMSKDKKQGVNKLSWGRNYHFIDHLHPEWYLVVCHPKAVFYLLRETQLAYCLPHCPELLVCPVTELTS